MAKETERKVDPRSPSARGRFPHNFSRLIIMIGFVAYATALFLVARRWELPPIGLRVSFFLALALAAEFSGKGLFAILFRRALRRRGHGVTARLALYAALIGTATARLVPAGGTVAPSAMAWAVRAEDDHAAGAALRTTLISYGGLLVVTGASTSYTAGTGDGFFLPRSAIGLGFIVSAAGLLVLVGSHWLGPVVAVLPKWARRHFGPTTGGDRITGGELGLIASRVVLEATTLWLVLRAFLLDVSPALALLTFCLATVIGGLPSTPGGLGFVEGGMIAILVESGFAAQNVVAPVLIYRIINYWLAATLGIYLAARLARIGRVRH